MPRLTPDFMSGLSRYYRTGRFKKTKDEEAELAARKAEIGSPKFPKILKHQIKKEKKKMIASGLKIGNRRNRAAGIFTAEDFELMALNRAMARLEYEQRHARLIRDGAQNEGGYYFG